MGKTIKQLLVNALTSVEIGYRVVRGMDYQTLSQYILKINAHKDIDSILLEVSRCLKDILGYELFGFSLKKGDSLDLWIDPRIYDIQFAEYVKQDFCSQNIDHKMHFLSDESEESRHNFDRLSANNIMAYNVMDGDITARMYILPKRKMLYHHNSIISTVIHSVSIALEKSLSIQHLENAVAVDPLTNCYNRRALDNYIENDIAYARRHKNNLAVIMFDMDNFKSINDVHGHQAGDVVLKEVSALITSLVRKSDYLVRYGGEEFVLVLPDSTLYDAVQLAHKLRNAIATKIINLADACITVTASFGVASLENKQDSCRLLREADERLYKAKASGKNTVVPSLLPCFADRSFTGHETARKLTAPYMA